MSVVEDDAAVRRSLKNLLRSAGYDVETFEAAEPFLDSNAMQESGAVLLDIQLPGMSGIEAVSALRRAGLSSKVLVFTGSLDEAWRAAATDAGADAFFTKPLNSGALLSYLEDALSSGSDTGR